MKALLLVLAVVGFVYLDSGYTVKCRKCNGIVCSLNGTCAEEETLCFILQNKSDTTGAHALQGCAETCPVAGQDQKLKCCNTDYCNSFF